MVGVSTGISLRIVGVDAAPLFALGSVSGIVVGFASQNLLLNLISGISLFVTRPFVVGDIVSVRTGAVPVAMGTIVNISPLRTTFLDEMARTVTMPNKTLTDMVITNFRKTRSAVPVRPSLPPLAAVVSLPAASNFHITHSRKHCAGQTWTQRHVQHATAA